MIGSYGDIVFEVSDQSILTPTNLSRTAGSSYATHSLIGVKPRSEYSAPNLRTVSFEIMLRADHGIRPRENLERLVKKAEDGKAEYLIVGGRPVSDNPFILVSVSETWDVIYNRGELASATVTLSLTEYV